MEKKINIAPDLALTEHQINAYIDEGRRLVEKSILLLFTRLIEEKMKDHEGLDSNGINKYSEIGNELIVRIKAINTLDSKTIRCDMIEIEAVLNITMSVVDFNYETKIDIPSADYAQDLIKTYKILKDCSLAYLGLFKRIEKQLYDDLVNYLGPIEFISDPVKSTVLYTDVNSKHRLGVFCFYTDKNGKFYYKNN